MTVVDKTKPDVLRVTEYILEQNKLEKEFSVQSADKNELNGIGRYRIAKIMRDVCLDPNGEGSLIEYTTAKDDKDNVYAQWQLNSNAYFSYLSYQSFEQAKESNKIALKTMRIAIAAIVISIIIPFILA